MAGDHAQAAASYRKAAGRTDSVSSKGTCFRGLRGSDRPCRERKAAPTYQVKHPQWNCQSKVTPFLMFKDQWAPPSSSTPDVPGLEVTHVVELATTADQPAEFVWGQTFMGFNGGPHFSFSEGFAVRQLRGPEAGGRLVMDRLVAAGATPTQCGWILTSSASPADSPKRFMELIGDKDPKR
jgi:hypothetical protein